MELFDFLKVMFSKNGEYEKLKDYEKKKFFFMVSCRFMSIAYPIQANMFNNIRVNQARTLDYWHRNMINAHNGIPNWIYTKTKKSSEKKVTKVPSDDAIKIYLTKNNYSMKQLDESVKLLGADSTYAPIFKIEKLLNSQ